MHSFLLAAGCKMIVLAGTRGVNVIDKSFSIRYDRNTNQMEFSNEKLFHSSGDFNNFVDRMCNKTGYHKIHRRDKRNSNPQI
jgi:hypothetical protein